jgi:ATP-dependent DNA ligase
MLWRVCRPLRTVPSLPASACPASLRSPRDRPLARLLHEIKFDGYRGAALNGEAVVLRPDNTSDFEALRSRQVQAEAVMVAYDIMSARVTGSSTVGSDPDPHQAPPSAPPASTDDGQWPLRPQ